MFRQNQRFHSQTLQNMQLGTMLLLYEGILTPTLTGAVRGPSEGRFAAGQQLSTAKRG